MAEPAIEIEKLTFKLSDLQKGRCHIRVVDSPNSGAKSDPKVGPHKKQLKLDKGHNREISWPQRTQQNGDAHVLTDSFHKKWKQKSNQLDKTLNRINISSTSSRKDPISLKKVFLPKSFVPRPRPYLFSASTAALASMSRSTTETLPSWAATCSGVSPREPRPEGPEARRQNPTERKGRKILRKFWHLKSGSFGHCGHSNFSLKLRNIVVLRCLEAIEFLEKTVAFAILVKMAWINSKMLQL